jgi:TonB-dependent SusC/RagA subfamily outer membrane receptor
MRYIYTLLVLLMAYVAPAQVCLRIDIVKPVTKEYRVVNVCGINPPDLTGKFESNYQPQRSDRIICRCPSTISRPMDPLVVLDGWPIEREEFSALDPNTIESITILKDAVATSIYGSRGWHGVVLITTKTFQKKIIIKDAITGSELPGATVTYQKKEKIFTVVSNDSGAVVMDKFRVKDEYEMKITMAGYVEFNTVVTNNTQEQTILLTRDVRICPEVIVGNSFCPKRTISCGYSITRLRMIADTGIDRSKSVLFNVFPNPVNPGRDISIDTKENLPESATVKIFSMSGQLLVTRPLAATDQKRQLTIHTENNWTAGIYIVQLSDKNGHSLQSSKLIIQ